MGSAIVIQEELSFIDDDDQKANKFNFNESITGILNDFLGGSPFPIEEFKRLDLNLTKLKNKVKEAVEIEIKTLILSAESDNQTPLYWSQKAQKNLNNSRHFIFKGTTHGLSATNEKAQILINQFINNDNINILDNANNEDNNTKQVSAYPKPAPSF